MRRAVVLIPVMCALASPACGGSDFEPQNSGSGGSDSGATGGTSGDASVTGGASGNSGTSGSGGVGGGESDAAKPCESVGDCTDPANPVCQPQTGTCGPTQCTESQACPGNELCIFQTTTDPKRGVCYPQCLLSGPACPANGTCVPYNGGPVGYCKSSGSIAVGEDCSSVPAGSINTGCVVGTICHKAIYEDVETACRYTCDQWDDTLLCPVGYCALGACLVHGDESSPPPTCEQANGMPCNPVDLKWTGGCAQTTNGPECFHWCRPDVPSDCTSPQTCVADPGAAIGVCTG